MKNIPYGHQSIDDADIAEVVKVLKSDWLTQGPKVQAFETALCDYTGATYAVAVSSGTAALHLAMLALDLSAGDEVITSPITFLATSNSIIYVGAKPVFCDIDSQTACLDVSLLEQCITQKTRCIVPVHFAGQPCQMSRIKEIADEYNLTVIEDAAHAIGASYQGQKIGACEFSDMTVFSFHPVKNITTGEGGAITTNNKEFYERLCRLRTHGMTKDPTLMENNDGPWYYEMHELGYNYRVTDMQCALGLSQLSKLDTFVTKRRALVDAYHRAFEKEERIKFLKECDDVVSAWHLCPILIDFNQLETSKQEFFKCMNRQGIYPQVHYIPVTMQPYYQKRYRFKKGDFINAEEYYSKTVSLPLYPELNYEDIEYIVQSVKECLR